MNIELLLAPSDNGQVVLTAKYSSQIVHLDKIDLQKRKERIGFVRNLVEKMPELDGDKIEEQLINLAAEQADSDKKRTPNVKRFVPFPIDCLPPPINIFIDAAAKAIGCDVANLAIPMLVALAAAIGNSRRLLLKRGWTAPSILWAMIVGESGTHKTPAIRSVLRPIYKRADEAARRHEEESRKHVTDLAIHEKHLSEWRRDKKTNDPPPEPPEPPKAERPIISDATVEAVAPILLENPRGVLLVRDELAGWLCGFDRYASRAGADASHWLSMHSGESIVVDRKTGQPRTIRVPNASVSILGGIQPGVLSRALGDEHRESGMLARFLLTSPPRKPRRFTKNEIPPDIQQAVEEIFIELYELLQPVVNADGNSEAIFATLSQDAEIEFAQFVDRHGDELMNLSGDLASAWSKFEEVPARLALVIHYVRWAAGATGLVGPDIVDADSMRAAIRLTEGNLRKLAICFVYGKMLV